MPFISSVLQSVKEKQKRSQEEHWKRSGLCMSCGGASFRVKFYEPGPEALAAGAGVEHRIVCINCGAIALHKQKQ